MEVSPFPSSRHAAKDLTKAARFALGPLTVQPSTRRVSAGAHSEALEPRAMRVLVALGGDVGRVFSRDDLIELCWDGVIVGDNAINRVAWQLRHLLAKMSDGAVRLETITKVGFRVVVEQSSNSTLPPAAHPELRSQPQSVLADFPVEPHGNDYPYFRRRKWTRRAAAGGVLVTGAMAGFAYAFREKLKLQFSNLSAAELVERGQALQKTGEPGSVRHAMEFYRRAVAIDPDYAPGWAAIALAYRHPAQGPPDFLESSTAQPHLIRSAVDRALALDPDNVDAQLALVAIYPGMRSWQIRETRFRTILSRNSGSAVGNSYLGQVLWGVGRCEEAISYLRRVVELDPALVIAWGQLAMCLHTAGLQEDAQIALDRATSRWPEHPFFWNIRYAVLTGSGRYAEAASFARDSASKPDLMPKQAAELFARIAEALASGKADSSTVAEMICLTCNGVESAPFAVPLFVAAGAVSDAFAMLEAYYFGGTFNAQRFPAPGMTDFRLTDFLFGPPLVPLRTDPGYGRLLGRVGLEDYWRKSGTQPDFRSESRV